MSRVTMLKHNIIHRRCFVKCNKSCLTRMKLLAQNEIKSSCEVICIVYAILSSISWFFCCFIYYYLLFFLLFLLSHDSRHSFSVLLGWANAIKVWANAIKMPDQHKYLKKRIFASYKMFRQGFEILVLSFNYFKLSIS